MNYEELVEILENDNPNARRLNIQAVADWLLLWADASVNIRFYGSVALDTKTMNRIVNPKLQIKEKAEKALFKKPLDKIQKERAMVAVMDAATEEAAAEEAAAKKKEEEAKNEIIGNGHSKTGRGDVPETAVSGGRDAVVDRSSALSPVGGVDAHPRKGRKKGKSKISQSLRTGSRSYGHVPNVD